jgi:hypothetical protein
MSFCNGRLQCNAPAETVEDPDMNGIGVRSAIEPCIRLQAHMFITGRLIICHHSGHISDCDHNGRVEARDPQATVYARR